MPIYTRKGDKGKTQLLGGENIKKSDPIISAMGEIDELNATIGVLRSFNKNPKNEKLLLTIQKDLFEIGAALAGKKSQTKFSSRIPEFEKKMDGIESKLPPLKNFILPDGDIFSAHAHLTRTICRRAERTVVAVANKNKRLNPQITVYLNRLSDLFFMLAREHNFNKKKKENIWAS